MLSHNLAAGLLGCCHFKTWRTYLLYCYTCVAFLNS